MKWFVNGRPIYYLTDNLNAARTVSTDRVWAGGGVGLSLDGAGQTLGIWDGGNVRASHIELAGRAVNLDSAGLSSHATHVAGTMIATGIDANAQGMSFAAGLRAYDFNNDEPEMAAEQLLPNPITVSNHSYSFITGWYFNFFGDGRWVWFGDVVISSVEDHSFGFYDPSSVDWDQIAFDSPNYLMVKSAGNDRNDVGAAPGTTHWHFDGSFGTFVLSTDTHPADGGATGYDTIAAGSASSKNIITVGAIHDIPGGYVDPSGVLMSSFSGWGPTDDGRIKPDIVANGVSLYSSVATGDSQYANFSGTSMSSPNTAGSLGLLTQHAEALFGAPLRSATMKALIFHTADEAGPGPGPDYMNGWGLLNTANAALLMSDHADATDTQHILEVALIDGTTESFQFVSGGAEAFRVTLSWTDPPGTTVPAEVDPPALMIVNDLDVRVIDPHGATHFPWVLDPATPSAAATTGDNFRDNAEQILIDAPVPGTYEVVISHKSSLSGGAPQAFSLIVSGNVVPTNSPPSVTLTSPADGAVFAEGSNITLAADASDGDGSVVRVEFYEGANLLGEDLTSPFTLLWPNVPVGSYSLTAVAYDDDGASATSIPVNITVSNSDTVTVVLQDGVGGYLGTRDAELSSFYNNLNFGFGATVRDKVATLHTLARFAIFVSEGGPVPDGAVIQQADLSLYKTYFYNHTYRVHRLLEDWLEGEVTWNEYRSGSSWASPGANAAGLDFAATHDDEASVGWVPEWLDFDVTAAVQQFSSGTPNFGWRLVSVSGNNNTKAFASRENADNTLRPKLVITYSVE